MEPNNQMLEELLELTRENNKILKQMRRSLMWGRALRIVYWLVILGVAIGSFYFLQPYIENLQEVYSNVTGVKTQLNGLFGF